MLSKMLDFRKLLPVLSFLFLYQVARGMTLPLFPQYFTSVHMSAIGISIAYLAYGASFLVFEALWGFIYERFGIKGIAPLVAIVLTSVAMSLFARPTNLDQVVGYEILLGNGLGGGGVFPRLSTAHLVKSSERGGAFGMLGFVYAIGATVGSLLGGASGLLLGIHGAFILTGAVALASGLPVLWSNRSRKATQESTINEVQLSSVSQSSTSPTWRRFNLIGIIVLGLVGLTAAGANGFFTLLFPNILQRDPLISATLIQTSIVLAIYSLSSGLVQPLVGSLGSKRPANWIVGCLVSTGVCCFALILTRNISDVYLTVLALGLTYSAITPLALSLLTTFVPRGYWGRTMGLYGAAEDVGIIVTTSLGGVVWGVFGAQYSYVMMGTIFFLVGTACFVALKTGILSRHIPAPITD